MRIKNVIEYEGIYAVSDNGDVYNLKKGIKMNGVVRDGYSCVILSKEGNKKNYRVNRIVFEAFKGRIIPNLVIDHIDGNKLNNNIDNLRQITTRENVSIGLKSKTKYPTGVSYVKHLNKYKAEISISRVRYYLGVFDSVDEAKAAYMSALNDWKENKILPKMKDRTQKYCKGCGQTKPMDEFYYVNGHGYTFLCKECSKKQSKINREKKKTL